MSPRAPALPPDQRRAGIVRAALGVLRERGQAATTRELAEAAGVAEGTLFRVFRSKEDLVSAALEQAFDVAPLLAGLGEVDRSLGLRERLVEATTILQARYTEVFGLMEAMGMVHPPERPSGTADTATSVKDHDAWHRQVVDQLAAVVGADAGQLRVPAEELVELIRLLTFSGSHPVLTQGHILSPQTIVEVLLDGTRRAD
ncbi:TetR/AcrR family transcriptional regulator [Ornithinimicrobium cavernae]|uniref:TetR/AcrR family transcriptional regulator n=1 Tax=Ornithinimicrobium cavernae TaxID=2666047 RepID=UPI000D68D8C3|nr:helix-turn-helix domain-containing protein [Ornithinimicrobium cavernae]